MSGFFNVHNRSLSMVKQIVSQAFPLLSIPAAEERALPLGVWMILIQKILGEFAAVDVCLIVVG